jgi:putative membrane protein
MLGGGFMWTFWILPIIAGVALVLVPLPRGALSERPGSRSNPMDILKERFARGEIERDEYEQKPKDPVRLSQLDLVLRRAFD